METGGLLKLFLDVDRLAVAGALAARPMSTDDLVASASRDRRTVLTALGDLRAAGIVVCEGERYRLDEAALRRAALAAAEIEIPMDPIIGFGMTEDERLVLARYFSGRVLTEIPSQRAKRLVVLQRLALDFDIGRRYTEREVNDVLGGFHPDWSALRRYLVDEGFLDREHVRGGYMHGDQADRTLYWRSGGRVTDLPSE
jgi:hypothetical protein